jgi:hypothetical protein
MVSAPAKSQTASGSQQSTVNKHLAEVRWRLHAPNTARAVVIALTQGELSLADLAGDLASA